MSGDPHPNAEQPTHRRGLTALLFPEAPRAVPGVRGVRMTLRALHVLVAGTLLGGHVFAQSKEALLPWLIATIISGGLLLALDIYATFAVMCQLRGVLVVVKCLLVALVALLWDARVVLLILALAIGVYGSHMSGTYRYRLLWLRDRGLEVDRSKG